MIKLLIPNNEVELALIKGILDAEGIPFYVHNDHFGSMWVGPQIELYNQKAVMVDNAFEQRARELLGEFMAPQKAHETIQARTTILDKARMVLEVLFFGWFMPGKSRKSKDEQQEQ